MNVDPRFRGDDESSEAIAASSMLTLPAAQTLARHALVTPVHTKRPHDARANGSPSSVMLTT